MGLIKPKQTTGLIKADGTDPFTGDQSMGGNKLTNVGAPTAATDAVRLADLQAAQAGLSWKDSCRLATTAPLGLLTGLIPVDGFAPLAGDRILVKDQAAPAENGIYEAGLGPWLRSADCATAVALEAAAAYVEEGLTNANTAWVQTNDNFVIGVGPVTFIQFAGGAAVVAGAGLSFAGPVLNVGAGPGIIANADDVEVDFGEVGDLSAVEAGDAASAGVLDEAARADHQHAVSTGAPGTISPDDTAMEGVSTALARADHKHAISTDVPVDVGAANAEGVSASFSRADHVHDHGTQPLGVGTDHALVTPDPGGVAGFMSPADKEKLDDSGVLTSSAPVQIDVGDAAVVGVSTEAARADHQHALPTPAAPADVTKAAASAGVSTTVARADHKHDVSTAAPVAIAQANAEGVATTLARADHVHDHGTQPLGAGTNHAVVTLAVAGFMSAADKTKLDGITAGAADRDRFQYGNSTSVPGGGTLQLEGAGDSLGALRMNRAGSITGASIQVNVVDNVRTYDLDMRINGVSVVTLALPISTLGAHTAALAVAFAAGDLLTVFLVRTGGAGASTFADEQALVEVTF